MSFIRKIINTSDLRKVMNIPSDIRNDYVEVLVLPIDENDKIVHIDKKQKRIKGNLIKEESAAWSKLIDKTV